MLDGHCLETGQWPFEHRLDDLKMVGVNLAVEQGRLFNSAVTAKVYETPGEMRNDGVWGMTLEVIPCPEQDVLDTKPIEVWNRDRWGDLEPPEILLIPRLVQFDWNLWPDLDVLEGESWRRFPSLPGRAIDEDGEIGNPEAFRLWNCWPLDFQGQLDVHDAYQDARFSSWLLGFDEYLSVHIGARSSCELAHDEEHPHSDDPHLRWGCEAATEWERDQREVYVLLDDDGMEHWRKPPDRWYRGLSWPTSDWWHMLLGFSARNAWASLDACIDPELTRQDERRYSPWLWSS